MLFLGSSDRLVVLQKNRMPQLSSNSWDASAFVSGFPRDQSRLNEQRLGRWPQGAQLAW